MVAAPSLLSGGSGERRLVFPTHAATPSALRRPGQIGPGQIGSSAIVLLVAAAALAAVALPIVFLRETDRVPGPTPAPVVKAVAGEIRTVPQLSPEAKNELIAELAGVLEALYGQAFLGLPPQPTLPPSPQTTPATRVDAFFTGSARDALRRNPEVFLPVETVRVGMGRVTFEGIATLEASQPHQALLEVDFEAVGRPRSPAAPDVRLRQTGSLLLVAMPYGWRVGSFDLDFSSRPIPSPSPEP